MNNTARAAGTFVCLLTLMGLPLSSTGCGSKPPPGPCDKTELIALHLEPNPTLNQDREGNPRSVVVRIFQLETDEAFQAATFEELWSDAKSSPSVVSGPDELTLIPGRREVHSIKRNPKATHIAMTANFREYHPESEWKAALELPHPQDPCRKDAPKVAADITAELANYTLRLR